MKTQDGEHMKKRQRQDVCVANHCSYGVRKGPVQKTLFYLFNQVITLSRHFWMARAEIKVFMKSDLELPGSSKECYLCES